MAPDVPSMTFSTTVTMRASVRRRSEVMGAEVSFRRVRIASAPRLRPMPQSPSPTMVS
jgi:hypothetical protein